MEPKTNKLTEPLKKPGCESEKQHEVVFVEFNSDNLEDHTIASIRALPNIAKASVLMRETLGSLMKSQNSLGINQDDSVKQTVSESLFIL